MPWSLKLALFVALVLIIGACAPEPQVQYTDPWLLKEPVDIAARQPCRCGNDPAGLIFCGTSLPAGCGAPACGPANPCPAGQFCLVNNCCPAPKDKGICVALNEDPCPVAGPFACPNFPICEDPGVEP